MNAEPLLKPRSKKSRLAEGAIRLDVRHRIAELKQLTNGWFDGIGLAPAHDRLDQLATAFENNFPGDELRLPFLYPTPEGGVRAEWSFKSHEISFEINLENRIGRWHDLNLANDTDDSREISLEPPDGLALACCLKFYRIVTSECGDDLSVPACKFGL
ncbi:MAG: hypothetical protein EXS16_19480 [Gemmataceae bacterium]|nr:hypothetical protein [Gemmataceae bacterium]